MTPVSPTRSPGQPSPASPNPRVESLLSRMTLVEKAAQMAQLDRGAISPDEVARLGIGSVLSGGGGNPSLNTPDGWASMVGAFEDASRSSRLGIPILYGADGVHGHSNVRGSTIFPHNIGLGATDDADLVERVYRATAVEMAATGVRWNFAPTVAVALDPRWGRTYESFGDDPVSVARLSGAAVRGLHGNGLADPDSVLACAKHFVGDGGTSWRTVERPDWIDWWDGWGSEWSIDQGDTRCDEQTLRSVHLPPYLSAIEAGALTAMASYSSWNGEKMHGHRWLLTEVLKGEMGFGGVVVSDWLGIDQLDPDPYRCVVTALGAGIDMVMVPFEYERFISSVVAAIESGDLPILRVDDAVRRILEAKHALGILGPEPSERPPVSTIGSTPHRALARQAVAASAVLLADTGGTLPIRTSSVLVAGQGADDIGLQCGGWTIEWTGGVGEITTGTTIVAALRELAPGLEIHHQPEGRFPDKVRAPIGIAVVAEPPYSEGLGDRADLRLPGTDVALVERLRTRVDRLVLVVLSGRPLVLDAVESECDAIIAGWLPGSEGGGIADLLLGRTPFSGRLPRSWPGRDGAERWKRRHGLVGRGIGSGRSESEDSS